MLPSILAEGLERAPAFDVELTTGLWVAAPHDLASTPRVATLLRWFEAALADDPAING